MSNRLDVKSVFNAHLIKRVIDSSTVELWCGRIGREDGDEPSTRPRDAVCDSCRAAAAFVHDQA